MLAPGRRAKPRTGTAAASTGFPAAVATALDALPATGPDEWVWILHDDANPAPDALAALLAAAEAAEASLVPEVAALWPVEELPRLLEESEFVVVAAPAQMIARSLSSHL